MYGWLRGIIFSKLALSVSRVAATMASRTVTTAQTSITALRWLNTARSSTEPLAGSNCSSVSGVRAGLLTCMAGLLQARGRIWTPRGPAIARAPAPALTTAAAGIGRSTFIGAKVAPRSPLTST